MANLALKRRSSSAAHRCFLALEAAESLRRHNDKSLRTLTFTVPPQGDSRQNFEFLRVHGRTRNISARKEISDKKNVRLHCVIRHRCSEMMTHGTENGPWLFARR